MRARALVVASVFLLALAGCSKAPSQEADANGSVPSFFGSKQAILPAGTVITVRLGESLGSKISHNGQSFHASVAEAVENDGKVIIPEGSAVTGHVMDAVPEGRFKGAGRLRVVLDSVNINGTDYDLQTGSVTRSVQGKGKRTAVMVGGGAGAGALIGGLAGGGKGALIGAALGAGAGTAGAAYTGNKEIVLPAESALSFKLVQDLAVKI
ncbi:MAG TPA: hypothetical protein VFA89_23705 [Terriglobales bacterium]|nr:hypothetical protein [Terriglobales bacterium]